MHIARCTLLQNSCEIVDWAYPGIRDEFLVVYIRCVSGIVDDIATGGNNHAYNDHHVFCLSHCGMFGLWTLYLFLLDSI